MIFIFNSLRCRRGSRRAVFTGKRQPLACWGQSVKSETNHKGRERTQRESQYCYKSIVFNTLIILVPEKAPDPQKNTAETDEISAVQEMEDGSTYIPGCLRRPGSFKVCLLVSAAGKLAQPPGRFGLNDYAIEGGCRKYSSVNRVQIAQKPA